MLRIDCKTGGLTGDYFLHFNQTKYWFDEQQKGGKTIHEELIRIAPGACTAVTRHLPGMRF